MASKEAVALADILGNKVATPIQIADGVKNMSGSGISTYEQQLNSLAGSAGLASTTSSFVALYADLAQEGGTTARWFEIVARRLGAVGGIANIGLLANDIYSNPDGLSGAKSSAMLNAIGGGLAIAAVIPGLNVATLGLLSVGFTAAALFRGDSATLGQDFDSAIAKLQSMLPDNPTEAQKLQLAETIDAMFNRSQTQFSVPVIDPNSGAVTGFRLESAEPKDMGNGITRYEFSDGTVLEQQHTYSYFEPETGMTVTVFPTVGGYNNIWSIGDLKIKSDDFGNTSISKIDSSGRVLEQSMSVDTNQGSYTATITYAGQTVIQRVGGTVAGQKIEATFATDSNGNLQISSVDLINGQPPRDAAEALAALKEAGLTSDTLSNGTSDATLANSIGSAATAFDVANNTAWQNFVDGFSHNEIVQGVATYAPSIIDALSLIKAIQSGEPLPVVTSGLRLANDLSILNNNPNYVLSGAASAASGVLSIMSLDAALKRGDTLGAISAGAQTISFAATSYAQFATGSSLLKAGELSKAMTNTYGATVGETLNTLNTAIPYLSLAVAIQQGDEVGAALATLAIVQPQIGVPLMIAYAIYSIVDSLFGGHDIPDPWGSGRFVWDGTSISIESAGETGGNEAVSGVMQSVLTAMNSLIEQQRQTNPTSSLGIIPNRMPSVAYDMSGYRYTDIDPLTGEERHPSLRFDTSGNPYNATAGSTESYRSIGEAIIMSALERQAIAPMWEVQTAKMQTDAGDPKAGLTEEARAGRDGQLASTVTGDTQTFRPVTLDLGGNGQIDIISKATSGISFDVDDSGYLKESAWISNTDAFLTLDRDYNGETNSGREMFSNSTVAIGRRGLAGMGWVDANYDGKITSADPVWNELRVWQDANSDGIEAEAESLTLNELGITELNYAMGTFTQNGIKKLLSSPDLEADAHGVKVNVVPEGILIDSSKDGLSLLVTRIDDMTAVQANQDGVSGYEDVEMIVSGDDLLANDTLGGFSGRDLTITGVSNFRHGSGFIDPNGFVHFIPEANYYGSDAGFDYTTTATANGQSGTGNVVVTLQGINDAPTLEHVTHNTRPVYGYTPMQYDPEYGYYGGGEPIYQPYTTTQNVSEYDPDRGEYFNTIKYTLHDTPISYEDTGTGNVVGADIDDPASSLTYTLVNQPQYGSVTIDAQGNFNYVSWKEPNVPSDRIVENGQYAAVKDGYLYTQNNLYGGAVYAATDVFQVKITDPHGASIIQNIEVPHFGPYLPPTPSGGGGKKPIAVDLSGNGFEFKNVDDSNVFFDITGDGWKRRTAWVSPNDGLLAFDNDGNGKIETAAEISFVSYKDGAQGDLEGLSAFDTNGDGVFSAADADWSKFGVWQDVNSNGITDEGEFKTLNQMSVSVIGLTSDGKFSVINEQTVHGVGSMQLEDGSTMAIADVTLAYSNETQVHNPNGTTSSVVTSPFSPDGEEINGTEDKDLILGKNGNNIVNAYGGDDVIFEDGGNDVIDAGEGSDIVYAGADNDIIFAQGGDDLVYGGLGDDMIFGGDGHDAIFADGGNDVVFAGNGNDMVSGGNGNDVISGDDGNDMLYGEGGNDALFGRDGNDELYGLDGYDLLNGGAGNDMLDGGNKADEMVGGTGDDTYVVDDIADIVTEAANEGIDTVISFIDYALADTLENLTLNGSENLSAIGNDVDNVLIGNSGSNVLEGKTGNDTLNGKTGADTLIGGSGDDIYIVDNAGDSVVESENNGLDKVRASVSCTLSDNVEELSLTGTASITATGNALDNVLNGNIGNNILDGGAGADTMSGGKGDDIYVVDSVNDIVVEYAGEGIDTIRSGVTRTLEDTVENLVLTGTDMINATGNDTSNILIGNLANNVLDAKAGSDAMAGYGGDDTYIVDNTDDTVYEAADSGDDHVISSVTYTLSDNVERMTLVGSDAIDGTGNEIDNILIGNSANNLLDGGAGADTMSGNAGNDTYIVDNVLDAVAETVDNGIDTIISSVSYVLPEHIENITLSGLDNISATGNELNNIIIGNSANNALDGESGSDILEGGIGNDVLIGGLGDDAFIINMNNDLDSIFDEDGEDTVRFTEGFNLDNVALRVVDTDSVLTAQVRVLNAGGCEQEDQGFDFAVTKDANGNYVSSIEHFTFNDGSIKTFDDLLIKTQTTYASNRQTMITTGRNDDIIYGNSRNNTIYAGSGNDIVYAGSGSDKIYGQGGNDALYGNVGNDTIDGGCGTDILSGSNGEDTLVDTLGNNAFLGGFHNDVITAGDGNDFIAGGYHDDVLNGGGGHNVFAFNRGDGRDTILPSAGAHNTLSLNDVEYRDISLRKNGTDLIVDIGCNSQVTLKSWYGSEANQNFDTLQIVSSEYDYDFKRHGWEVEETPHVETFDFKALVEAFDAAKASNPRLNAWNAMNTMLQEHLSMSDSMALGGDLAFAYAKEGDLSRISIGAAQDTLSTPAFGIAAQLLTPEQNNLCHH